MNSAPRPTVDQWVSIEVEVRGLPDEMHHGWRDDLPDPSDPG